MTGYQPPPNYQPPQPQQPVGAQPAPAYAPGPPAGYQPPSPPPAAQPWQQQQQAPPVGYGQPSTAPASTLPAPAPGSNMASLFATVDPKAVSTTHARVSGGDWFKFKQGENIIRVLPPLANSGLVEPWVVIHKHVVEVPGLDRPLNAVCPKEMLGQRCPLCEQRERLQASTNPMDIQQADKLRPRREVIANIIDRRQPELGVRKARLPGAVYDALCAMLNNTWQPLNFADPMAGCDILVVRQGTGKNDTKYPVVNPGQPSPLAATYDQMAAWAGGAPSLMAETVVPSYEQIVAQLNQAMSTGRGGSAPSAPMVQVAWGQPPAQLGPGTPQPAPQQWGLDPNQPQQHQPTGGVVQGIGPVVGGDRQF